MIYSRYIVSSSHRFSIPSRWLGDLARRGSLSYPTGQEYQGRHLKPTTDDRKLIEEFIAILVTPLTQEEMRVIKRRVLAGCAVPPI